MTLISDMALSFIKAVLNSIYSSDKPIRKVCYKEFPPNLSGAEGQENGRKKRLREAKFPIFKPMESFDFDAAPELDIRLMKELSNCD